MVDNIFGYLASFISGLDAIATANIDVNYKKPIYVDKEYLLICYVTELSGRKIKLAAKIVDEDDNIYVDAKGLMIRINWENLTWTNKMRKIYKIDM